MQVCLTFMKKVRHTFIFTDCTCEVLKVVVRRGGGEGVQNI